MSQGKIRDLDKMRSEIIQMRVKLLKDVYGSIRAVSRALNIDHAYLSRLMTGEKTNPSPVILKKLGLD